MADVLALASARLKATGRVAEVARRMLTVFDPDRNVDCEPSPGFWQPLKVRLLWLLVPEDLL